MVKNASTPDGARRGKGAQEQPITKPTPDDLNRGINLLREHLVEQYGSKEESFKKLDTNGNGFLSVGEIKDSCTRLKINLIQVTGIKDFNKIYLALDKSNVGELSMAGLFDVEIDKNYDANAPRLPPPSSPKKLAVAKEPVAAPKVDIYESIDRFRKHLVSKFGTEQKAFHALDANGNGLLSAGEVKDACKRHKIDVAEICGCDSIPKMFKVLDVDGSSELTFFELMRADPVAEFEKIEAEKIAAAALEADRRAMRYQQASAAAAEKAALEAERAEAEKEAAAEAARLRAELAHYLQLREFLIAKFGSAKAAFKNLDTNGNGLLSQGELTQSLKRLRIDLTMEIPGFSLKATFKSLDVDGSGELSFFELFIANPDEERSKLRAQRKAALIAWKAEREEEIEIPQPAVAVVVEEPIDEIEVFRAFLVRRFGSKEEAFQMLDADGSGMLSFGELRVSLERLGISVKDAIHEKANLAKVFRRLDADQSGELSFHQLMIGNPQTEAQANFISKKQKKKAKPKQTNLDVDEFRTLRDSEMSEAERKIMEFARINTITELDLQWAHLGKDGANRFAAALAQINKQRSMKLLQFEGNYVGTFGLKPLAMAIEKYCDVKKLNLAWNGIDDESAERLASIITNVKSLEAFDLSNNHISDRGAERLARAVTSLPTAAKLKVLNLERNIIGLFGMEELRYACSRKVQLKLRGNTPESTSGCNMKVEDHVEDAVEEFQQTKKLAGMESSQSLRSLAEDQKPGADHKQPSQRVLRLPGEIRHNALGWTDDFAHAVPQSDRLKFMISQARRDAKKVEKKQIKRQNRIEAGGEDDRSSVSSVASTVQSQASLRLSQQPPKPDETQAAPVGAEGITPKQLQTPSGGQSRKRLQKQKSQQVMKLPSGPTTRDLGISLDMTQKKPAGDFWPPGLELDRALLRATLLGEGKDLPPRPQSQGMSIASRRRTGAVARR